MLANNAVFSIVLIAQRWLSSFDNEKNSLRWFGALKIEPTSEDDLKMDTLRGAIKIGDSEKSVQIVTVSNFLRAVVGSNFRVCDLEQFFVKRKVASYWQCPQF